MKYILRFNKNCKTITLRFIDYDSMKYVIDLLEQKNISYVLLKDNDKNKDKFNTSCLLDFGNLNEYKNTLVEKMYLD